jgi:Fe-S cluster assembly iron-binding protein IscA
VKPSTTTTVVIGDKPITVADVVEGAHGAGFKFGNPNVTGSCGCGSSFTA